MNPTVPTGIVLAGIVPARIVLASDGGWPAI